jgi:hypothetical protein
MHVVPVHQRPRCGRSIQSLDAIRKYAPWIILLGIVVGIAHRLAEEIVASAVTSCYYNAQDCALADALVPVIGFPVFSLGLNGPDLNRDLILNSIVWALGTSVIAWLAVRKWTSRHKTAVSGDDGV